MAVVKALLTLFLMFAAVGGASADEPFTFSKDLRSALKLSQDAFEELQDEFGEYRKQSNDELSRDYKSRYLSAYREQNALSVRMLEELEAYRAKNPGMNCTEQIREGWDTVRMHDGKMSDFSELPLGSREERISAAVASQSYSLGSLMLASSINSIGLSCAMEKSLEGMASPTP